MHLSSLKIAHASLDIDDDFLEYVKELVETTVNFIKDCPKRINDGHLTGPIFTDLLTVLNNLFLI